MVCAIQRRSISQAESALDRRNPLGIVFVGICSISVHIISERIMVRLNFESFEEQYAIVRQSACGGMACSVLVLVALEVIY